MLAGLGSFIQQTIVAPPDITIANASLSNTSFYTGNKDDRASGLAFNNSGTIMILSGLENNKLYEYILSTPWDISSASFSNKTFDVTNEVFLNSGIHFKSDGTLLYIIDSGNRKVYQYNLSTPFDISTTTFANKTVDVISQDGNPRDINFNDTGTKMFLVGAEFSKVWQYNLTTAYDISTATYANINFDVSSEVTDRIQSIEFVNSGKRFFITDSGTDNVFEYDLTTPYDITTASYNNVSFNVGSEESIVQGSAIDRMNKNKMFIIGRSTNRVYMYNL